MKRTPDQWITDVLIGLLLPGMISVVFNPGPVANSTTACGSPEVPTIEKQA